MQVISGILLLIYLLGAWKFWAGFGNTNFVQNRIGLTVLWPVMLVSRAYRENFRKALKG